MKKFFKDGFDTIIKLVVSQLGMTMFGIMVTMATRIVPKFMKQERNVLSLIVSIFSVIFYLFLLYIHIWNKGGNDRIMVDGRRAEHIPLKGLYLSLVANALNIILAIIMCATYYFCDFPEGVEMLPATLPNQIFGAANDLARIIQGMYIGILLYISPNAVSLNPFIYFAIIIPSLLTCTIGYSLGFNNVKMFGTSASKKKNK